MNQHMIALNGLSYGAIVAGIIITAQGGFLFGAVCIAAGLFGAIRTNSGAPWNF